MKVSQLWRVATRRAVLSPSSCVRAGGDGTQSFIPPTSLNYVGGGEKIVSRDQGTPERRGQLAQGWIGHGAIH